MTWNLLLLPLLGGSLFPRNCYYTQIKFQRLESYRLPFESASCSVALVILARLIASGLSLIPMPQGIGAAVVELAPFPFFGTTFLAFLLGPASAWIGNRFLGPQEAKELALDQSGDKAEAIDRNAPVLLTLASRKIYIGYVRELPNLEVKFNYISLLPALSGYRDDKDFEVRFTTNYISLWQPGQVAAGEFVLVLPVETIKSASIFDLDIYQTHFSPDNGSTYCDAPLPVPVFAAGATTGAGRSTGTL